jgi:hypothetical protein
VRLNDGQIAGWGSLFPNREGRYVGVDGVILREILAVVANLEERMAESERRDAVSVRASSVEDWE